MEADNELGADVGLGGCDQGHETLANVGAFLFGDGDDRRVGGGDGGIVGFGPAFVDAILEVDGG